MSHIEVYLYTEALCSCITNLLFWFYYSIIHTHFFISTCATQNLLTLCIHILVSLYFYFPSFAIHTQVILQHIRLRDLISKVFNILPFLLLQHTYKWNTCYFLSYLFYIKLRQSNYLYTYLWITEKGFFSNAIPPIIRESIRISELWTADLVYFNNLYLTI